MENEELIIQLLKEILAELKTANTTLSNIDLNTTGMA